MQLTNSRYARIEPNWIEWRQLRHAVVPFNIFQWLRDKGSLTTRIRYNCKERFRVNVLEQGWGRPFYSEQQQLSMRNKERAVIRAVHLLCDDIPWVFARTLIPASSLRGPAKRLTMLGDKPLGAVLFADPTIKRGQTQVARLLPRHPLFSYATRRIDPQPAEIWGRRTIFYLAGYPILVNEIFLPDVPEYL